MKKVLGVLVVIVIAVIVVMLFFGDGLGFGFGSGTGTGNGEGTIASTEQENTVQEETKVSDETEETKEESVAEVTITIEVKQSQYLIDGKEMTLSEIEALITAEDAKNTSFILEDNYAAAKAWDEIKALFTNYEVDVVEQ